MRNLALFAVFYGVSTVSAADPSIAPRIEWYGTLQQGLEVAKEQNRPILLVSGAPQCLGVSGIW